MEEIILDQDFNKKLHLVKATKGKRFANYMIDRILAFIFSYVLAFIIGALFVLLQITDLENMENYEINQFVDIILSMLLYSSYFILTEGFLNGKSLAKYITKTRVLKEDGSKANLQTIVMRSLSRIVPFNAFSFLGDDDSGWHDKWSDTIVIDEKLSTY